MSYVTHTLKLMHINIPFTNTERWKKAKEIGWYIKAYTIGNNTMEMVMPPSHFKCKSWGRIFVQEKGDNNVKIAIPTWYYDDYVLVHGDQEN